MVPALSGANCNPEPPSQCTPPVVCGPDEFIECIDTCSLRVPEGGACDADPCGAEVCDFGLACVDNVCTPAGGGGLEFFFCNVGANPCTTGNYCRRYTDDAGAFPRPDNAPSLYEGQCVAPRPEGSRCDGPWALGGDGVLCEPGAECLLDPRGDGVTERACFRSCDTANECPCDSPDRDVLADCVVNTPETPPGSVGICATCIQNDEACSPGGWDCCSVLDECQTGECCHPDGDNCTAGSDECCGRSACGLDGTCHACPEAGKAIDPEVGDCCPPLVRRGDVCAVACRQVLGDPCMPRSCPENPGVWTCTVEEGDVCEPTLSAEMCDGLDNDCDGGVDNIVSTSCTGPVLPSADGIFQGCPGLMLSGMFACRTVETESGPVVREECIVTEGFCAWDTLGDPVDGSMPGMNECFRGAGDCSINGCLGGEWCCSIGDGVDHLVCTRVGTINYRPPGTEDVNQWPLECWEPDAPWVGTCPAPSGCVDNDDCGSCASDPGCGWCVAAGQCLPGDSEGAESADCGEPGVGWLQDPGLCEASCMDYFSCDSCARNSECGYCTDTGSGSARCLPGNGVGPSVGDCSGDWIRDELVCS